MDFFNFYVNCDQVHTLQRFIVCMSAMGYHWFASFLFKGMDEQKIDPIIYNMYAKPFLYTLDET